VLIGLYKLLFLPFSVFMTKYMKFCLNKFGCVGLFGNGGFYASWEINCHDYFKMSDFKNPDKCMRENCNLSFKIAN
jgi:hypothetical protein